MVAEDAKIVPAQDSMDIGQGIPGLEQSFRQLQDLFRLRMGGIEGAAPSLSGQRSGLSCIQCLLE